MSGRLSSLSVGPLKTTGQRRPRQRELPSLVLQTKQMVEAQAIMTIPEMAILQQIPGIQPFLTKDFIPDLIYILQLEGVKSVAELIYPPQTEISAIGAREKTVQNLINQFQINGVEAVAVAFADNLRTASQLPNQTAQDILNAIYTRGASSLAALIQKADPADPKSIIFTNPSQDVHKKTQEIEIELILNQPDVVERDDITCECGSRRVRAVPVQVRRADEPPTVFAQCVACKRKWRFTQA